MKQMKLRRIITLVALVTGSMTVSSALAQQDSVKKSRFDINYGTSISFGEKRDSIRNEKRNSARFVGGVTFTRLDIGFAKLIDNGDFTLSPANKFLGYRAGKTTNISFDVLQLGYRFNSSLKVYVAGGFDWTLIRLKNDYTIQATDDELTYVEEPIKFSKNRFSNSYLHIPLNLEFRSKENHKGKRFYFVVGPEVGFLLNGKVKQISEEQGKQKFKDDYHFAPFRVGGTARMGYNSLGVFVKYYETDLFETTAQKGLKTMAFGLTFGLN